MLVRECLYRKGGQGQSTVTVTPDHTIEEVAEILLREKQGGVPVVDERGYVLGTITQEDVIRQLVHLTGVSKGGVQFALRVEDRAGCVSDLTNVIRGYGGRVLSVLCSYEDMPEGYHTVYVRACKLDPTKLDLIRTRLSHVGTLLYCINHCDDERKIYQVEEKSSAAF